MGGMDFASLGSQIFNDAMTGIETMGGQQLQMAAMAEDIRQFNETMKLKGRAQAFEELMSRADLTKQQKDAILQQAGAQVEMRGATQTQAQAGYGFRQQIKGDRSKAMLSRALSVGVLKGMKSSKGAGGKPSAQMAQSPLPTQ